LYRDAEAALAARDLLAADRQLAALLAQFPESSLLDQALYERARIAYRRRAWSEAQRQLDRLATIQASPLREPGAYLACRIAFESSDDGAATCLRDYRARYPQSPHAADTLGMLAELAHRGGGCAAARAELAELTQLHAGAALTRSWQQRCPVSP
jgi:outer membrane protein assembly factor BamD (BamD/ComL family)